MVAICIYRLPHSFGLPLPERATADASGMDLRAAIPSQDVWILSPGERCLIPTGFLLALPFGYEAQVRPRSGLALNYGITVLNSPGTIDADYRGELKVLLINHGTETFQLKRGERIAQLVIAPTIKWSWQEESSIINISSTERGSCGYGSTGMN